MEPNPLSTFTGTDGNALTTTKDLDLYYEKIAKVSPQIFLMLQVLQVLMNYRQE